MSHVMRMNQRHMDLYYAQMRTQESYVNINGFIVGSSQSWLANQIFKTYPKTTRNVDEALNQELRTSYMNVLLGIYKTLLYNKKPPNISDYVIGNFSKDLSCLTKVGFDVEWLRSKLEIVSLVNKKRKVCRVRIKELKEEIKKLKSMMSSVKVELKKEEAKLENSSVRAFFRKAFVCEKI